MDKTHTLTTQADVRAAFWLDHRHYRLRYWRSDKAQNDYPVDVRCAWVDYIDRLQRDGTISEQLAAMVTL